MSHVMRSFITVCTVHVFIYQVTLIQGTHTLKLNILSFTVTRGPKDRPMRGFKVKPTKDNNP